MIQSSAITEFCDMASLTKYLFSNNSIDQKLVLGCGSNVVDQIYKVKAVPKIGEKGFFQSATKIHEKSIVGGVTLNHLSWASLLGVPTGLLALQGVDHSGKIIREKLHTLKISQEFIQVHKSYTTAESYVFVQEGGERSIIMASGATSLITDSVVEKYFCEAILNKAGMVTTEISQVPLSGVIELLTLARRANVLTVVDFDVSPQVALKEAKLGDLQQLKRILELTDILKPAKHAALELLHLIQPKTKRNMTPRDIICYLQEISSAKLVAMTNGRKPTFIASSKHIVEIPTEYLDSVVDATGAGDAFLGGLIAGLHYNGVPENEKEIREIGNLANKTGAANCQVLGGLPEESTSVYLEKEITKYNPHDTKKTFDEKDVHLRMPVKFIESVERDSNAVNNLLNYLDISVLRRVLDVICDCTGTILTSAIGKSGIIASRMASSLSSISIPSHFVHACEWSHGDLGKICSNDVIVFISHSGNTVEVVQALQLVMQKQVPVVVITGHHDSHLGKTCPDLCISYACNDIEEPLGGIPSTSIITQDAIVNGMICELIKMKQLTQEDFHKNHPGGGLGEKFNPDNIQQ